MTAGADRFLRPVNLQATRRNYRRVQVRRLLVGAANVLFVSFVVLGGLWLYQRTQSDVRFAVRKIELHGLRHADPAGIDTVTQRFRGTNLFRLDIESVRKELAVLPWVDRVAVEKKLPDTLAIHLFEREPVALVLREAAPWYVDDDGVTFAPLSLAVGNPELPLIAAGSEGETLRCVRFIERLRKEAPAAYSRVSEISPVPPDGFVVFDRLIGAPVFMREADAVAKWEILDRIASASGFRPGAIEYADIRFAERVVVKPFGEIEKRNATFAPAVVMVTN